jgi:hypothetical protein
MTISEFGGDHQSSLPERIRRCRTGLLRAEPLGSPRAGMAGLSALRVSIPRAGFGQPAADLCSLSSWGLRPLAVKAKASEAGTRKIPKQFNRERRSLTERRTSLVRRRGRKRVLTGSSCPRCARHEIGAAQSRWIAPRRLISGAEFRPYTVRLWSAKLPT